MNLVELRPDLIEHNQAIISIPTAESVGKETRKVPLRGVISHGYNRVFAQAKPGSAGKIAVTFDVTVDSISDRTFDGFRKLVSDVLGDQQGRDIGHEAGIRFPPPAPSSRMAAYIATLFSHLFRKDRDFYFSHNRHFSKRNCENERCTRLLSAIRDLEVSRLHFHGTLEVAETISGSNSVVAYIPLASIEYSDELTIPFSGYSNNVKLSSSGDDPGVEVPENYWKES